MSFPSLHLVVVDLGADTEYIELCKQSIVKQSYTGMLTVTNIKADPDEPGGAFYPVMQEWMRKPSDYMGYITTGSRLPVNRLQHQIAYMEFDKLSGCYGDICTISSRGEPTTWEEYPNFKAEMIGVDCIDTRTLILNKKMFLNAGGFDHVMAGSNRPDTYLLTMAALGGKVQRLSKVLLEKFLGEKQWGPNGGDLLAWHSVESSDFWHRFEFEKFVRLARDHYRTNGW